MTQWITQHVSKDKVSEDEAREWLALGKSFIHAVAAQDFDGLESLFQLGIRFRALLPSKEVEESTSTQTVGRFQYWFGGCDVLQVQKSVVQSVFDRLYLAYSLRVHSPEAGWRLIEQHMYCMVNDGQIADLWLLCSGFRPDVTSAEAMDASGGMLPQPYFGGDAFYNAGDRGCAEGPVDHIAAMMRKLDPGQTLEIYATDPSVVADLPAWCRLSGHSFEKQEAGYFLLRRG